MKRPASSSWVVLAAILSAGGAVAGIGLWRSSAVGENAPEARAQYIARIRGGLSEVEFAAPGGTAGDARRAVNSLARVIHSRSGVELSRATRERLAALEEQALRGDARLITAGQLAGVLTQSISERVATLSDD